LDLVNPEEKIDLTTETQRHREQWAFRGFTGTAVHSIASAVRYRSCNLLFVRGRSVSRCLCGEVFCLLRLIGVSCDGGSLGRRDPRRGVPDNSSPDELVSCSRLVALLLDSGLRRNDESEAVAELSGKAPCHTKGVSDVPRDRHLGRKARCAELWTASMARLWTISSATPHSLP
jgi:hypothetical protein